MASVSDHRKATYADLLDVPPHRVAEIVNGELFVSPRPAPRHARASSILGGILTGPFDKGAAYFEIAPDWICEVLSPSTAALDRIEKMPVYASNGVAWAWLIDPLLQTLEVFRTYLTGVGC